MENPQAFPAQPVYRMPDGCTLATEQGGMTLRDYFAAQAMAATINAPFESDNYASNPGRVAEYAYQYADAMLAEREKGGK